MRRADKAVTELADVEAILRDARVLHLAMCRGGEPYVVPVFFGLGEGCLYVHSAPEGRKIDAVRENPRVCFEAEADFEILRADIPCGWGARYRSVIGTGRAEKVEDLDEKKRGLEAIMRHYGGSFLPHAGGSAAERAMAGIVVLKIVIDAMTGKASGGG